MRNDGAIEVDGVDVIRDPHLGTAISGTAIADWGELSTAQVARDHPDAVVVFIGANEGFDLPGPDGKPLKCCGAPWAAAYATRARTMMDTYRRASDAGHGHEDMAAVVTSFQPRDTGSR